MAQILRNLGAVWHQMSFIHRVLLLTIVLAVAGAALLLGNWATQPKMTILYGGLSPADAAKVTAKLGDRDIPYELANGGTTVLVPAEQVNDCRMSLASQGLPGDGQAGYKILDDEKLGTSPFAQRVNYVRAVEGELAKTIRTLNNVTAARVHIVRPEGALFRGNEQKSSATVVVGLKGGHALGANNVAAVVHLVAGAVEGLQADDVVVVDTAGNLLSGDETDDMAGRVGSFQAHKSQVEQRLADKAEQMLAAALGPNRASVRVSVEMTSKAVTRAMENYDPAKRVARSETIDSESSTGTGEGGSGEGGNTKAETIKTEYLVSKTTEQSKQLPGEIVSKSVAVLVDLSPPEGEEDGEPVMKREDVEALVAGALGLTLEAAGEGGEPVDALSVVTTKFPRSPQEEPVEAGFLTPDLLLSLAKRASLGLVVIGMLLALKIFGGKSKSKSEPSEQEATGELAVQSGQMDHLLPGAAGEQRRLKERITRALEENPDEVKRLFLTWAQSDTTSAK
ncbi:MAG: flagellar M-ring protein FliF [Phycisphaerae bacterium]|nr:flagellar M-ring protein FliF [Phycisphaerae bacterium]